MVDGGGSVERAGGGGGGMAVEEGRTEGSRVAAVFKTLATSPSASKRETTQNHSCFLILDRQNGEV
jgi:hypothetical protein